VCCLSVNNRTHSFTLSGNTQGQNAISSGTGTLGPNFCNEDWLIIPCATNVGRTDTPACVDRICGGTLNTEISTTPATIISKDIYINLTFIGLCIFNIFTEYNQQDATFHNLFISVGCSTCFRRFFRPPSGAQIAHTASVYSSDKYLMQYVQF